MLSVLSRRVGAVSTRTFASAASGVDIVSPRIGLTPEQEEYYSLAKQVADSELKPFAAEWDRTSVFPLDTFKKFGELGFGAMFVRGDVGGTGLTRQDTSVIVEALSTGCVGTTAMLTIHNMCAGMIDKFGSEEHRQHYLPKLASMDLVASYCLTEPGSGSDAGSLQTKAELDEATNEYVINGGKAFISGGGMSDIYLVMCRTGTPADGAKGISCIIIPKGTPGLSFGNDERKLGWHVQPTRQLIFENLRVPAANVLGTKGHGFKMAMAGLDGGRINIGSCSLGAAQACFEIAVDYVKERKQFGKHIGTNQALQFKLANMAQNIQVSRLALRNAAHLMDTGHPAATAQCAMAKRLATDKGFEVCNDALQLLGGYGYLSDYHVERYLRDCRVHQILEGTNEIMQHIVGRSIVA